MISNTFFKNLTEKVDFMNKNEINEITNNEFNVNEDENNFSKSFKLPIKFVDYYRLNDSLINDLEILNNKKDNLDKNPLFDILINPIYDIQTQLKNDLFTHYTTDIYFLIQTQTLIKNVIPNVQSISNENLNNIYNSYKELIDDKNFLNKYQYIEIGFLEKLNKSDNFLQALSIYNMASPLITLLTPIVLLILPFALLKLQGIAISLPTYFKALNHLFRNHAIGKLINSFNHVSWDKRIYLLIMFAFYILQIYQNAIACYKFFNNMKLVHNNLFNIRDYLYSTIDTMQNFNEYINHYNLNTYLPFCNSFDNHLQTLIKFRDDLEQVVPLRISLKKSIQIGYVMKLFYTLRNESIITEAMRYSILFHTYISNMKSIYLLYSNGLIKPAEFYYKKSNKWITKDMYYPPLLSNIIKQLHSNDNNINIDKIINSVPVSFNLHKSYLITGPNASGKTTLIKSTILNTIISQQFGCGFYKKLHFKPFTHFHCYLDIPDTSGRDSLFQAEARRSLDIIHSIQETQKYNELSNHLCIFDEIYSGTNPVEAIASAYSFIKYLSKHNNVKFLLTTHFYKLCKISKKIKNTTNYHLEVKTNENDNSLLYTYKFLKGMSNVKGGMYVLKQLNYPKELINEAELILKNFV